MFLERLYLHNFRNYEESLLEFSPSFNYITGMNAQGKTNVLEAIYCLITGHSFRTAQMKDMIRHGSSALFLEAHFVKYGVEQKLKMYFDGRERKIIYNQTLYRTSSCLLGLIQGVISTPDDIELIKGSPQVRRQFLDMQIAQGDPLYVHHLQRYMKAMRQRNHLLRVKSLSSIETWEYELAYAASYITEQRKRAIEELNLRIHPIYSILSLNDDKICLTYKSGASSIDPAYLTNYYMEQYQSQRHREVLLGMTITGPHKDDVEILLNHKEVRYFASEGQKQTCVSTMRIAEWDRLRFLTGEVPLMMIDDVGTSLDENRKEQLFNYLDTMGQVFLSFSYPLKSLTAQDSRTFVVKKGSIPMG